MISLYTTLEFENKPSVFIKRKENVPTLQTKKDEIVHP